LIEAFGGEVHFIIERHGRLNLEEIGPGERADSDHSLHVAVVELVPRVAPNPVNVTSATSARPPNVFPGKSTPSTPRTKLRPPSAPTR